MKTRIFTKLLYALMATMLLTSCDEHFEEDFSWHSWMPGMVYSTNGDVTTYEKCIENGNTPEAVLFYVDAADEISGIAYAVSLNASFQDAFINPDTIYVAQGTSTDINACDGESNTTALRYGKIESPIASSVQAKYFIPSVGEMYKLYAARHIVNATIERCGAYPFLLTLLIAGTGRVQNVKGLPQTELGVSASIQVVLKALTSTPHCQSDQ